MASGKIARRTAVGDVAELLDSPEVTALIAAVEAVGDTRGRKGFGTRALVGACLVKGLFALPTWTWVAALIAEHPGLQARLGASPSVWACYRFARKLRENHPVLADCIDSVAASLREQYPDFGRDVAIDASDLPAFANGQRYVSQGGRERERFSDPDASWGHRSAVSTRKGGGFYGFKLHMAVCTATGLPLAWQVETARRQESNFVAPLLDAIRARGIQPETCVMDKGYDNNRVYAECEERGVEPIIPLRGAKKNQPALPLALGGRLFPRIPRHTQRFRDLYRGRAAVEREFGRLKHDYGLAPLRVRGLERVALHADLTMLARLGQALARARAMPLAA
ncbi:MAG: transposase [Actinobacteria bacterium]|nr:transposase [Actinomycetota bacterium]